MKTVKNPMPKVKFDGQVYSLKSRKTVVPNLSEMSPIAARFWIRDNTRRRGYFQPDNPLTGIGGAITAN
jgi:hypothetical protein